MVGTRNGKTKSLAKTPPPSLAGFPEHHTIINIPIETRHLNAPKIFYVEADLKYQNRPEHITHHLL